MTWVAAWGFHPFTVCRMQTVTRGFFASLVSNMSRVLMPGLVWDAQQASTGTGSGERPSFADDGAPSSCNGGCAIQSIHSDFRGLMKVAPLFTQRRTSAE